MVPWRAGYMTPWLRYHGNMVTWPNMARGVTHIYPARGPALPEDPTLHSNLECMNRGTMAT
eukprot:5961510-Karenia_brevis.AAC.1